MTESLRERVEAAILADLTRRSPHYLTIIRPEALASDVTGVVFEAMAGARPCVTCGKGIGPAKVERGYVQCYDCARASTSAAPHLSPA